MKTFFFFLKNAASFKGKSFSLSAEGVATKIKPSRLKAEVGIYNGNPLNQSFLLFDFGVSFLGKSVLVPNCYALNKTLLATSCEELTHWKRP